VYVIVMPLVVKGIRINLINIFLVLMNFKTFFDILKASADGTNGKNLDTCMEHEIFYQPIKD